MRSPIQRSAQGVVATVFLDGWPRQCTIEVTDYPKGNLRLFGTEQIRALHWILGEILATDPMPDDRPRKDQT